MIETKKLSRTGSRKMRSVNLRIIATTRKDLRKMSAEDAFNSNLYYLINVIPLEIPPLRSRREETAHALGIGPATLYRKIKKYEL